MKEVYLSLPDDEDVRSGLVHGLMITGHSVRIKDGWIIFAIPENNVKDVR